jgi:hypothetical protein
LVASFDGAIASFDGAIVPGAVPGAGAIVEGAGAIVEGAGAIVEGAGAAVEGAGAIVEAGAGAGAAAGAAAGAIARSTLVVLPCLMIAIGSTLPFFIWKIVISASLRSPFSSNSMWPVAPSYEIFCTSGRYLAGSLEFGLLHRGDQDVCGVIEERRVLLDFAVLRLERVLE